MTSKYISRDEMLRKHYEQCLELHCPLCQLWLVRIVAMLTERKEVTE